MRRRLTLAVAVVAAAGLALAACGGGGDGSDDRASGETTNLAKRTVKAGEVDVKIEPRQLDAQGAAFKITLDTHSVELSMDLARARLEVNGTAWSDAAWTGDGPDGHHREGELRFTAQGPAQGTARLTLSGFPTPIEASWDLGN